MQPNISAKMTSENPEGMPEPRPLSERCRLNFERSVHACFGISPFNSHFSVSAVAELARWGLRRFESIHFFLPDEVSAYTLEALGYDSGRARQKARRQGRYVRNKICRALVSHGVSEPDRFVLDGQALAGNGRYVELLDRAHSKFDSDPEFRSSCLDAAGWVLEKRLPAGADPTSQQRHSAVRYLLAEFPLFVDTAGIVGAETSVFCYHQSVPLLERLYRRELNWHPARGQGFLVLDPEAERHAHR